MDKKLIFLDIDGTILAPGKGISQGVKEGLKEARARGHQVFVCTGRSCHMLPEELEDVELDGVIANAGSDIWIHGENIYRTAFEESQLRYAFEVMDRLGAIYILEGYDRIYVSERELIFCLTASLSPETIRSWPAGKSSSPAGETRGAWGNGRRNWLRSPRSLYGP